MKIFMNLSNKSNCNELYFICSTNKPQTKLLLVHQMMGH